MTPGPEDASHRPLVLAGLVLLVCSTLFPLAASLMEAERVLRLVGVADVVLAFVTVMLGLIIVHKAGERFGPDVVGACFRAYRVGAGMLLVFLVVFLLTGEGLRWNVLLPGLAWRAWLLAYVLPAALTLWHREKG